MLELVLPGALSCQEMACVENIAQELGLQTEKDHYVFSRIFRTGVRTHGGNSQRCEVELESASVTEGESS